MQISVIIISKNEHPRLKLSLLALARQSVDWQRDAEIILIDDGSTPPVGPAEIPANGPQPRLIRHDQSRGRSASRNEGARLAKGRRLLFLDGDVLLSPKAVELHLCLADNELGRGEQRHLRGTRFFSDPRTGTPWPGKEARVKSMGNLAPYLVTEEAVANAPYDTLLEKAEVAIYPGAAPRKLYELEMAALRARSVPLAQWMTAAGHNFSIPRETFLAAGGFPEDISINEHRELALRLCRDGAQIVVVEGAISLHLTHREGYRDPMAGEDGWEQAFALRHPFETHIMMRFWRTLGADSTLDPADQIPTLERADELLRQHQASVQRAAG
jgi:GT2 family glycosyltransferase